MRGNFRPADFGTIHPHDDRHRPDFAARRQGGGVEPHEVNPGGLQIKLEVHLPVAG